MKSFIVACVYRHPCYNKNTLEKDYTCLDAVFTYLSEYRLTMFILGDFNLRNKVSIDPLLSIATQHNLTH
jgi:hypothetical protein